MPRLWSETLESHRREVQDAVIDATIRLVEDQGLLSVTMSRIAEETGIGRATLYKYFPDVGAILRAWHGREISAHLRQLAEARDRADRPLARLRAVLETYASIARDSHSHHHAELAELLHRGEQVPHAEAQLRKILRELLAEGARAGEVRTDVTPDELASYSLYSLAAARAMESKPGVRRLVNVTLAGLRPQS
jgi:AcrR family transcriptional regulator